MDTVHECDRQTDRQTDGRTKLRSQRPCNAERRTVKMHSARSPGHVECVDNKPKKTCITLKLVVMRGVVTEVDLMESNPSSTSSILIFVL